MVFGCLQNRFEVFFSYNFTSTKIPLADPLEQRLRFLNPSLHHYGHHHLVARCDLPSCSDAGAEGEEVGSGCMFWLFINIILLAVLGNAVLFV
jgi:hypothetical protein